MLALILIFVVGANNTQNYWKKSEVSSDVYDEVAKLCNTSSSNVQENLDLVFTEYNPMIQKVAANNMSGAVLLGVLAVMFGDQIRDERFFFDGRFFESVINNPAKSTLKGFKDLQIRFFDLFLSKGELDIPADVQTYASTQWAQKYGIGIFGGRPDIIMQRVSIGNHCFVQAPMTMIHYEVSLCTGENAGAIDIRQYILFSYRGEMFYNYLKDLGGSSQGVIEGFYGVDALQVMSHNEVRKITRKFIKDHGAILLAQFHPFEGFCKDKKDLVDVGKEYKYTKARPYDVDKEKLAHAMLLIDVVNKTDTNSFCNETIYLVQNWGRDSQFIQMSAEFLFSRGTTFYYFESYKFMKDMPSNFKPVHYKYDEASEGGTDKMMTED